MTEIICKICKKKFQYKCHYHNHLKFSNCVRQFPITTIDNTIKELLHFKSKTAHFNSYREKNPFPIQMPDVITEEENIENKCEQVNTEKIKNPKKYWCECGAGFTKKSNMHRHRVPCTKRHNAIYDHTVPQNESNKYANKNSGNGDKIDQQTINNLQQNIVININYYDTPINNNKNKIVVNNFGKEDTLYIDPKKYKTIFNNPFNCLLKLINDVNFNPNHPENMNIKRKSNRSKYVEIVIDGEWKNTPMSTVIHTLINTKMDIMDNIVNVLEPNENSLKRQTYEHWAENISDIINTLNIAEPSENIRQLTKKMNKDNKEIYKSINNFVDCQLVNRVKNL